MPSLRDFPLEFLAVAALKKQGHALTRRRKEFDDTCVRYDAILE